MGYDLMESHHFGRIDRNGGDELLWFDRNFFEKTRLRFNVERYLGSKVMLPAS